MVVLIKSQKSPKIGFKICKLTVIPGFCLLIFPILASFWESTNATTPIHESRTQLAQVEPSLWEAELRQAKDLRNQGKLTEAIAIYQQILAQEPQQRDAKIGLALTLAWDNQLDASIKLYQEIIQIEPHNLAILLEIAPVYTWKGNFSAAIATYRQILKLDPTNSSAKLGLAEAYGWDSQFDAAIAIYQDILATEPDNLDLKLKIAQILGWADRLDAALDLYEQILSEHPDSSKALAGRAQITYWLGKPIKAIALYKQALDTFPNEPELTLGLARVYHTQQASGKALKLIEPLLKTDNNEAKKLLTEIQKSLKPRFQFGFNTLTDSDDLNSQTYNTKFTTFIAPQSQLELGSDRTNIKQPNFENTTINTYNINFTQVIDPQWQIGGGLGITDFSNDSFWYLRTRWQATDKINLYAQINHQPLGATVQTIENNVSLTSYSLGTDFILDEKTQIGLGYERANFNPDNRRDSLFIFTNRVVLVKPFRLELGYLFRNLGYQNKPGLGYFSPSRFVQHGALVSINLPVDRNFSLFSRNLIGIQQIDEGDRELSLDLTTGLNWQLSSQTSLKMQYHHFNISTSQGGSGYQANEFSTQLLWKF